MKSLGYFLILAGLCAGIFFFYRAEQARRAGAGDPTGMSRRSRWAYLTGDRSADHPSGPYEQQEREAMAGVIYSVAGGVLGGLGFVLAGIIRDRRKRAAKERRRWGMK